VTSACWDAHGRRLLVGTSDGTVCLRDGLSMRELASASAKAPHPVSNTSLLTSKANSRSKLTRIPLTSLSAAALDSTATPKITLASKHPKASKMKKASKTGGAQKEAEVTAGEEPGESRRTGKEKKRGGSAAAQAAAKQGGEVTGVCFLRVPSRVSSTGNNTSSSSSSSSSRDSFARDEGAVAVVSTAAGDLLVFEVAWAALKSAKSSSSNKDDNAGNESQDTTLPSTPELPLLRSS